MESAISGARDSMAIAKSGGIRMSIADAEIELERLLNVGAISEDEYNEYKGKLRLGASSAQLEAIKLVADWCKWFTTIEVAIIAAIGAFLKAEKAGGLSALVWVPSVVAVICFVISITLTAAVLSSLPEAVEDIHPGQTVWSRPATLIKIKFELWRATVAQLALFVCGIAAFAFGVVGVALS
jgi:hypothetical protein